jgi:hypothetical protein
MSVPGTIITIISGNKVSGDETRKNCTVVKERKE